MSKHKVFNLCGIKRNIATLFILTVSGGFMKKFDLPPKNITYPGVFVALAECHTLCEKDPNFSDILASSVHGSCLY